MYRKLCICIALSNLHRDLLYTKKSGNSSYTIKMCQNSPSPLAQKGDLKNGNVF